MSLMPLNNQHDMKRGDLMMPLTATLTLAGYPINVSGCAVRFIMRPRFKATPPVPVVNQPADILDPNGGRVRYRWQAGDTDVAGDYAAEFEVTSPDGKKLTVPNDGFILVRVRVDIA